MEVTMPELACKPALSVLLLSLSLAPALSCGGDADSASGFAAAYCDLIKPCCAMANLRTDGQQCQLLFGAFGGQASYNKEAGETCLAEARAAAGRPDFCQNLDSSEPSACDRVFGSTGKKQPGETCTDDDECAPSSEGEVQCESNFGTGGAEVRKCQLVVKGKEGDKPCVGTKEGNFTSGNVNLDDVPAKGYLCHVSDGLRCDSTTDTCVKLKVTGEACQGNNDCVRTAYCEGAMDRCTDRKAIGAACTPSFSNDECVAGGWCKAPANMCAAQVADGAACTEDDECKSGNCLNGKCDKGGLGDIGLAFICGAN
jgi:hypothetical protein